MKWRCKICGHANSGFGKCSQCGFQPGVEDYYVAEIKPNPEPEEKKEYIFERNSLLEAKSKQPMYVLWLIREGLVQDKQQLITHFVGNLHPQISTSIPYFIDQTLEALVSAGLVEISAESERLKVTKLYWRIKGVMGYSLKDFAKHDPENSMLISPVFGLAKISVPAYDLFVLMPFRAELKPVYEDHITDVAKELKLTIARADDLFTTGPIIEEIWSSIAKASITLADCTGRNPNVFYEIGIAHTLGKPVVLITQNEEDVPFDLRNRRFIKYEFTPRGMEEFQRKLKTTLTGLKTETISSSN
jgi:hypothetical protein